MGVDETPHTSLPAVVRPRLLADADRPGGWLLLVDRIRQSYVDLDDPTYLDFEYVQSFADVLDALPPGRLAVTHVGGGAGTLARYVAATRPGSPQIVLEPDAAAHRPGARPAAVPARRAHPDPSDRRPRGRRGAARRQCRRGRPGRVRRRPGARGADHAGVLRRRRRGCCVRTGCFLANVADGPPLSSRRRLARRASRSALPKVLVARRPAVFKGRRFGNVVHCGVTGGAAGGRRSAERRRRAMFPHQVLADDTVHQLRRRRGAADRRGAGALARAARRVCGASGG